MFNYDAGDWGGNRPIRLSIAAAYGPYRIQHDDGSIANITSSVNISSQTLFDLMRLFNFIRCIIQDTVRNPDFLP